MDRLPRRWLDVQPGELRTPERGKSMLILVSRTLHFLQIGAKAVKKLELDGLAPESAQQLWDSNLKELEENYRPLTDAERRGLERLRRQELVERISSPVWLDCRRCWAEPVAVSSPYIPADVRMDGERTSVDWDEIIPHWPCTRGADV